MKRTLIARAAWPLACLLAMTVAVSPGSAAAGPPASSSQPAKTSLAATAAVIAAQADPARALRATEDAAPATSEAPSSFFKSSRGKAVLVLMAAGIGYTVYSTKHDDVKRSPLR